MIGDAKPTRRLYGDVMSKRNWRLKWIFLAIAVAFSAAAARAEEAKDAASSCHDVSGDAGVNSTKAWSERCAKADAAHAPTARVVYLRRVYAQIVRGLRMPKGDARKGAVALVIDPKGKVTTVMIFETSGDAELDSAVVAAVRTIRPGVPPGGALAAKFSFERN